jgi:ubiquinone/menaquinone biosynthesis C-methylase UbiE
VPDTEKAIELAALQTKMKPSSHFSPTSLVTEEERIKQEYERRSGDPVYRHLYSLLNPAALVGMQSLERALMRALRREGTTDVSSAKILDVGCGSGSHILRWINYGASPGNVAGIDLLSERVEQARRRLPGGVDLRQGDASSLPYERSTFDIVTQYVVFSSILSADMKQTVAREMLRVLQPNGLIIWYDFWLNPRNPQTRGIKPAEIRKLFEGCNFKFYRITLAPPVARCLAPFSFALCYGLESLLVLNTHYLAVIHPG